jgi:hypothetical protein
MMRYSSKERLKHLRGAYPAGTRIVLVQMDNVQAPPTSMQGTVVGVDDTVSLLVQWDNGSGRNVICEFMSIVEISRLWIMTFF